MLVPAEVKEKLATLPGLTVKPDEPLAPYTRFAIGGPAKLFCETADAPFFAEALRTVRLAGVPNLVIGGGTNLVVSDKGFCGVVLRFTGAAIHRDDGTMRVESGALLQDVVDASIAHGLKGMHTMTGIPGNVGGAVYGNAGAYGNSMHEVVEQVVFTDGDVTHTFSNQECRFRYRESLFKQRKDWVILEATLRFTAGDSTEMGRAAAEIRAVRDAKYPPSMRCAGSIFKNVFLIDLPDDVKAQVPAKLVRDGKIPSAWFLEQAGVKGWRRGDIQVATYHANLIYNDGAGTAADLVALIGQCKDAVRDRFGFDLQEEVQYVGICSASR